MAEQPIFKDSQQAFQDAIDAGRLSANPGHATYAGNFMYIGTWDGVDAFKHNMTREYLDAEPPEVTTSNLDAELAELMAERDIHEASHE